MLKNNWQEPLTWIGTNGKKEGNNKRERKRRKKGGNKERKLGGLK